MSKGTNQEPRKNNLSSDNEKREDTISSFSAFTTNNELAIIRNDNYKDFYDDSSDEEDYNNAIEDDNLERIAAIFDLNSKRSFSDELTNSNLDTQISVFLHDIGVRLIQSKEVNKLYYPLKRQMLHNNTIIEDEQIKKMLNLSFIDTFKELYPTYPRLLSNNNLNILEEKILTHKRDFVKSVSNHRFISNMLKKKLLLNLPQKEIKITEELLVKYTKEIYDECKINYDERIKYSKKDKAALSKYNSTNKIKQKLADQLKSVTSGPTIKKFVSPLVDNLEFKDIKHSETEEFLNTFQQKIVQNFKNLSSEIVHRDTLPNNYSILLSDACSPESLAQIRLMNRSDIRKIKNLQAIQDNPFDDQPNNVIRHISFKDAPQPVSDRFTLYSSGKRKEMIDGLSTYESISNTLEKIKNSFVFLSDAPLKYKEDGGILKFIRQITLFEDYHIAKLITSRLKGKDLNLPSMHIVSNNSIKSNKSIEKLPAGNICYLISKEKNIFEQVKITKVVEEMLEDFISNFTYLLFGTEVARNPTSLLIHRMALELVIRKKLFCKEMLESMPMPLTDAVQASRWQHGSYDTLFPYKYDKADGEFNKDLLDNFIKREASIFKKWLNLKNINISNRVTYLDSILNVLIDACKQWYKINLETEPLARSLLANEFSIELSVLENLSYAEITSLRCSLRDIENLDNLLDKNEISISEIIKFNNKGILEEMVTNGITMTTYKNDLEDIAWLYINNKDIYHILLECEEKRSILEEEDVSDIVNDLETRVTKNYDEQAIYPYTYENAFDEAGYCPNYHYHSDDSQNPCDCSGDETGDERNYNNDLYHLFFYGDEEYYF